MKVIKNLVVIAVLASTFSCTNQKTDVQSLETEIDSASYALGLDMAVKVRANFKEANTDLFLQGYRNGIDSTNLLMNQKDLGSFLRTFFQKQQVAETTRVAEQKYAEYKKQNEAFIEANKNKEGVKTTASGLQYIVLKEGKGEKPSPTSRIKIHYHGTTIENKVFDSSVNKNKPYEANANQFVAGFTEGLLLMKEGAKYKFFIPHQLAYGPQARSVLIKPFTTLIFEVEMLEILKK